MDWSPVPFTFSLFWKFIPEVTRQAAVQLDAIEWETMARDSENVYYTVLKTSAIINTSVCVEKQNKRSHCCRAEGRKTARLSLSRCRCALPCGGKPFEFAVWRRWQEAAHYPRIVCAHLGSGRVVLSHLTEPRPEEVCRCKFFVLETVNTHDRRDVSPAAQ